MKNPSIPASGDKLVISPTSWELVEVVDRKDRPVAVLPLASVHRQSLWHRSVLVLIYDDKGRLYLQKRAEAKRIYPSRWDVSVAGHVRAGESREGTARRILADELGLSVSRLTHRLAVPASAATGNEFVTLFSAGVVRSAPSPNPDKVREGMFADRDEVAYLVESCRDMLTPGLVYFWESGLLFPAQSLP